VASGLFEATTDFRRHGLDTRLQRPLVRDATHHRARQARERLIESGVGGIRGVVGERANRIIRELEQKVAANPTDHQARFDFAVALNAAGQRKEAAEQLIAIVKRDRKWNDDGARRQLVQFFEAWGPTDEATVDGRRKLSSILFA